MLISSIVVWTDPLEHRLCQIHQYASESVLELLAHGQSLLSYRCPTLAAAFNQAEQWRAAYQPAIAAA